MLGLAVSQFTLYTNFVYIESDRELIRLALVVLNYLNKVICFASKENPLNDSDFTRSRRVGCRRSSSPPSTAKYEVLPSVGIDCYQSGSHCYLEAAILFVVEIILI